MYPWKPCSRRRGPLDATFPDTHLTACDLHCSGDWRYCSLACDGVTGRPATSRGLEIWCPLYGHAAVAPGISLHDSLDAARRWRGYTLQYCSKDNSRASTDHGSLTRYLRAAAAELLTAHSKHFAPHNLRLWLRWPSGANYLYSANFWLHYSAKYE